MAFVFVMLFLLPLFDLLIGWILLKRHSAFPDVTVGYHAGRIAAKNESAWKFANLCSGRFLIRAGVFILILDAAMLLLQIFFSSVLQPLQWFLVFFVYLLGVGIFPPILTIAVTEVQLKKHFDPDGAQKDNHR